MKFNSKTTIFLFFSFVLPLIAQNPSSPSKTVEELLKIPLGTSMDKVKELLGEPDLRAGERYLNAVIWEYKNLGKMYFDNKSNNLILTVCSKKEKAPKMVFEGDGGVFLGLLKKELNYEQTPKKAKPELSHLIFGILNISYERGLEYFKKKDYKNAQECFTLVTGEDNSAFSFNWYRPYERSRQYSAWISGNRSWIFKNKDELIGKIKEALKKKDKKSLIKLQSPVSDETVLETDVHFYKKVDFASLADEEVSIISINQKDDVFHVITGEWKKIQKHNCMTFHITKSLSGGDEWEWTGTTLGDIKGCMHYYGK